MQSQESSDKSKLSSILQRNFPVHFQVCQARGKERQIKGLLQQKERKDGRYLDAMCDARRVAFGIK